jgi:hypothetical protein
MLVVASIVVYSKVVTLIALIEGRYTQHVHAVHNIHAYASVDWQSRWLRQAYRGKKAFARLAPQGWRRQPHNDCAPLLHFV